MKTKFIRYGLIFPALLLCFCAGFVLPAVSGDKDEHPIYINAKDLGYKENAQASPDAASADGEPAPMRLTIDKPGRKINGSKREALLAGIEEKSEQLDRLVKDSNIGENTKGLIKRFVDWLGNAQAKIKKIFGAG